MNRALPPLILFTYKRPQQTRRTLEALAQNEGAPDLRVLVYSDGPKSEKDAAAVQEVRQLCRDFRGFAQLELRESEKNRGLAASVIQGVSENLDQEERVIVLEDDLVTSPHFLRYMLQGLSTYANEERVASIHGYCYPVQGLPSTYFLRGADCWGWATWRRAWKHFSPDGAHLLSDLKNRRLTWEFDFEGTYPFTQMLRDQLEGRIDSWAIRWHASAFLADMLTLYPGQSLVQNAGLDGSGTHTKSSIWQTELSSASHWTLPPQIEIDPSARKRIADFFLAHRPLHRKAEHYVRSALGWT